MTPPEVPFSRPYLTGQEQAYIATLLSGNSTPPAETFRQRCEDWLEHNTGSQRVLLTHSCTDALELAAILLDLQPGDEVIMPSFTFTSTANAFVLRGAVPVFVDIRTDTMNIDETLIEQAITKKTRAIVPVHYAGSACEMDTILDIAKRHDLKVVEDAAQCLGSSYKGRPLGTLGDLGTYSFHASKNIQCGEGGALLINNPRYIERAEILLDKGTTRAQYRAGKIRQYSWVDMGAGAPPSELQAAYLLAQLEASQQINQRRLNLWDRYYEILSQGALSGQISCLTPAQESMHNAHIFAILLRTPALGAELAGYLKTHGIQTAAHYQPLHLSEAGRRYGRSLPHLPKSKTLPYRLLRLPLWNDLPDTAPEQIAQLITGYVT